MKEKIMDFFQDEKVKSFIKKVFNKRNFKVAIIVIVFAVFLKVGFCLIFQVNGVVTKVESNSITVANFFTTQTINTAGYPVDTNKIKVGDRIKITKNIQGQVLYIRGGSEGKGHDNKGLITGNKSIKRNQLDGKNGKRGDRGRW